MIELQVTSERAGLRLDRYLALELTEFSRLAPAGVDRAGFVRLNGEQPRARELVKTGDVIQLEIPALEKIEAQAEAIAFPDFARGRRSARDRQAGGHGGASGRG
jgi:ribosomal 50S subunit-recycling heat shock protein